MEEFTVKVYARGRIYPISCVAQATESESERLIEPEFYIKEAGKIPQGKHHELELTTPVWDGPHAAKIHFHRSELNGRNFVCWTGSLPTIEAAMKVFRLWCLGTVYTMATGDDLTPLFKGNHEEFIHHLDLFGVRFVE